MVGSECSRLASDDVRLNRILKRKFGHRFRKVEVDDLRKVYARRDLREIDDSMKEYEYNRDRSDVDPEYLVYLNSDYMAMWKNQDKKAVNIDAANNDPQYDMFWSCLKPHGTLCVLEVSENNGLSMPIIYGADELSNQKAEGKWKDAVTDSEIEEKNRGCSSFKSPISSKDQCSNEDVFSVNSEGSDSLHRVDIATNGHSRYDLRGNSNVIESKKDEADNDGDYAWYLTHSNMICQGEPDRNKLVCEANKHRRDNSNSSMESKRYALRCSGNVIKTKKVEAGVVSRKNDEYEGCCTGFRLKGSKAISQDRPDLKVNHEAKHGLSERDNDTPYMNANSMCFVNSEKSDDARVEGDDISLCTGNSHGEINSNFRMELIKILRKPYNDSEHKKLVLQVSTRKKVDRHIDLRHGRAASYSGKKHGKSYLDQHFALRRKLEAAKDDSEKLNLLRGFFFWLQNLTWEDSFYPWRDKECLAVLPEAIRTRKRQI